MKMQWKAYVESLNAQFDTQGVVAHFGKGISETKLALEQSVWYDLSTLGIIEISGEDAQTFLQGQFTNDVKQVSLEKSQFTAWCNAKGRVLATFYLWKKEDIFYLILPQSSIPFVLRRLAMYVLRSKVKLHEITNETHVIGLSGEIGKQLGFPESKNSVIFQDDIHVLCLSGNVSKWLLISSPENLQKFTQTLDKSIVPIGTPAWKLLEIIDGIPQITPPTADAFTPHMLNLQLIEGVSFKKGCYTGQEIVSRTQYLGKVKRRIYLAKIASDCPNIGETIIIEGEENTAQVINVAPHYDGHCYVLVVVSNAAVEANNVRLQNGIPLIFLDLPYVVK
jgi:tRNA-modifying protein YgfZ